MLIKLGEMFNLCFETSTTLLFVQTPPINPLTFLRYFQTCILAKTRDSDSRTTDGDNSIGRPWVLPQMWLQLYTRAGEKEAHTNHNGANSAQPSVRPQGKMLLSA